MLSKSMISDSEMILEHLTARMAFTRALLLRFASDSVPKDDKVSRGNMTKVIMDEVLYGTEVIPREGIFE